MQTTRTRNLTTNTRTGMSGMNGGVSSNGSTTLNDTTQAAGPNYEFCFIPDPYVTEYPSNIEGESLLRLHESKKILSSTALLTKLQMIERAVLQNIYYYKQLSFKGL